MKRTRRSESAVVESRVFCLVKKNIEIQQRPRQGIGGGCFDFSIIFTSSCAVGVKIECVPPVVYFRSDDNLGSQ